MRFLILGRSVGLKKKNVKKNHKKSRNRRPWYPRTTLKVNVHISGLTKYTIFRVRLLQVMLLGDSVRNLYSAGGPNATLFLLTNILITFLCIRFNVCLIVVFIIIILDLSINF